MNTLSRFGARSTVTLVALASLNVNGFSFHTGVTGASVTGCTCHSTNPGSVVTFSVSGPATLAHNAMGSYTITINGGGGTAMGIDMTVSAGTLGLVTTTNLQLVSNEISHTDRLTNRSIQFTVTAPASGSSLNILYSGVSDFANWNKGSTNQPLPIQLSSFTVKLVSEAGVNLEWITLSEINNYGFRVQRRSDGQVEFADLPGVFIEGHGTTSVQQHYAFTDKSPGPGANYYRLDQIDLDGSNHLTDAVKADLSNAAPREVPQAFVLSQAYPNPFNPTATISYGLPVPSHVTLTVYNTSGQEVATLVNENVGAGFHEIRFNGSELASGAYFYRLRAGEFVQTRKLLLVR